MKFHQNKRYNLLPIGNIASAFTIRLMYPEIAIGWSGTVIPATAAVPIAAFGKLNESFPSINSIIPPPNVLCRKISRGRAGNNDVSDVTAVSWHPTAMASTDAIIPATGPAIE